MVDLISILSLARLVAEAMLCADDSTELLGKVGVLTVAVGPVKISEVPIKRSCAISTDTASPSIVTAGALAGIVVPSNTISVGSMVNCFVPMLIVSRVGIGDNCALQKEEAKRDNPRGRRDIKIAILPQEIVDRREKKAGTIR